MHQYNHKYSRTYVTLYLLWTMIPVAFGEQVFPTTHCTVNAHDTQLQSANPSKPALQNTQPFTIAQQQWLRKTLKEKDSDKKRFKKLLANITHQEAYVREAAFQTLDQLLAHNPKLATKKEVTSVRKVLQKVDHGEEAKEALQLLCVLVKLKHSLASAAAKVIMDLTVNGKDTLAKKGIGLDMLAPLTQTVIDNSPKCLEYLLHGIHKRIGSVNAEHVTVQTLSVTNIIFNTDTVKKQSVYLNKTLDIVLDAARSKDDIIENMAHTLLEEMIQQHPSLTTTRFNLMLELAQDGDPNMDAMEKTVTFAIVDQSLREQIVSLLIDIFRTTDLRVRRRASIDYRNNMSHGLIVDAIFHKIDKKLAASTAKYTDDLLVRAPALRLLQKMACVDPSYLPKIFPIFQRCTKEGEQGGIKQVGLRILAWLVQNHHGYTPEIAEIANQAAQDKYEYIREAALHLLSNVLAVDDQYAKDQEVLENIKRLSQDKHAKVQQLAKKLLAEYAPEKL